MYHLAILAKKRELLPKIISGEKTIESRWYKFKKTPYNSISKGDIVYFKDSGKPVTAKAEVSKVLFFDNLDESKVRNILRKYGKQICIPESYAKNLLGKNFCTLIFLENVKEVEPFHVDKRGYGMMAAWITLEDISQIRI